ncbi:MAG TPA: hypothetical protein DDW52_06525 [Planctomycetaceae bacterium]|nr:hypothetical protein [Planctomycetaceae bacterium]
MKWITRFTVLAAIALPIVPVLIAEGRNEIARWYVAAAVNALHLKQGDHDALMRKAVEWSDGEELTDAWRYRLAIAMQSDPSRIPALLKEAGESKPVLLRDSQALAQELADYEQFRLAYETQSLLPIEEDLSDAVYLSHLNQLAYFRSLGNFDLESALEDIEKVLKAVPADAEFSRSAYLDTRAWILYRLGRPGEALVDMEKCLSLVEQALSERLTAIQVKLSDEVGSALASNRDRTEKQNDATKTKTEAEPETGSNDGRSAAEVSSSDFDRTRYGTSDDESITEAGLPVAELAKRQQIRSRPAAVLGGTLYYHRAMILLALEREDDAEEDLDWLREQNLPADGTLF